MTDDITRIRRNWALAVGARDILGEIFYQNLFVIAPDTRQMFPETLDEQGQKLVQTLSWIVDHLDQPDELSKAAEDLAHRHVAFGVVPKQYGAVGQALIATLQTGLGDAFSADDEGAWARVYSSLSDKMIAAAYPT